jgi:hypothetical protein
MDRLFLAIIAAALVTLISSSVALVYGTAHTAQLLSPRPTLPVSVSYRRPIDEEKALFLIRAKDFPRGAARPVH